MSPIESFITNLLKMRWSLREPPKASHYQTQIQQCDGRSANRRRHRTTAQAQEGLTHINALLVDEDLDSQRFATNLLQMRSHYQHTVDEQKRSSASARGQLVHINALLAEQMVMQHRGEQTISMQATAIANNPVLTEGIDDKQLPLADLLEAEPTDAPDGVTGGLKVKLDNGCKL